MRNLRMLLTTLVLLLAPAIAEARRGSWDDVAKIGAGRPTTILEKKGAEHKGQFVSSTDSAVVLNTNKGELRIERKDVRRVAVKANHRTRNALIGVGIGVAIGLIIDQTLGAYFRNEAGETAGARALTILAPTAILGGIGALISGYHTIYDAGR